jgi:hypothetical protein
MDLPNVNLLRTPRPVPASTSSGTLVPSFQPTCARSSGCDSSPLPNPPTRSPTARPTHRSMQVSRRLPRPVLVLRRRPTSAYLSLQPSPPSATPGSRTINQTSHRILPTRSWARFQTYVIAGEECVTKILPRQFGMQGRIRSKCTTQFIRAIFILLSSSPGLVITGSES